MQWDLFCRVVDNFGDIGVCWRLAADLAARGDEVRLWLDDASALRWMAPDGAAGVDVLPWPADDDESIVPRPHVVEAFGCHLPAGFTKSMSSCAVPPVWINLEYLSAEDYVERSHGLPSPQSHGPARGLNKWFFYPGFTRATGGLLREADLIERQRRFDAPSWRHARAIDLRPGERCVSLFCYVNDAVPALVTELARSPTLLLVTPGFAEGQVRALFGNSTAQGALRLHYLQRLAQVDYDHLLWSSDLNLVRGEDSFVRAQWAGKPFLWQIYPQDDGAHARKLDAFAKRFLASASPQLASAVTNAFLGWNGLRAVRGALLPPPERWDDWRAHCVRWRVELEGLPELSSALRAFAAERR